MAGFLCFADVGTAIAGTGGRDENQAIQPTTHPLPGRLARSERYSSGVGGRWPLAAGRWLCCVACSSKARELDRVSLLPINRGIAPSLDPSPVRSGIVQLYLPTM